MRQLQEAPLRAARPNVSPLPPPSHVGNGERGQLPGLFCGTQQEGLQDTAVLGPDPHPLPCCSERPLTHGQQLLVGVDPVVVLRGWKKRRSITQCLLQAQPTMNTERGQHRGQKWGPIWHPRVQHPGTALSSCPNPGHV